MQEVVVADGDDAPLGGELGQPLLHAPHAGDDVVERLGAGLGEVRRSAVGIQLSVPVSP